MLKGLQHLAERSRAQRRVGDSLRQQEASAKIKSCLHPPLRGTFSREREKA